MPDILLYRATGALVQKRNAWAPRTDDTFQAFSRAVFSPGTLDARTKQLIAVAVAHVTQCPWCIKGHVKAARREGATGEAIRVAAEVPAGAGFAHSFKALDLIEDEPSVVTP